MANHLLREESGAVECLHGFEVDNEAKVCHDFMTAFCRGYSKKFRSGDKDMLNSKLFWCRI